MSGSKALSKASRLSRRHAVAGVATALALALSGCGDHAAERATPTVTVTRTVAASIPAASGGRVEGPGGVAIVVPPNAMKSRAEVSVTEVADSVYDIHIAGSWTGKVSIEMPLVDGQPLVAHQVGGTWRLEEATVVGGKAVALVDHLSLFSNLWACARVLRASPGAAVAAAKCLRALGIKKAPEWLGKKIIGLFNQYDACEPLSTHNWTLDWIEVLTTPCHAGDPPMPPVTQPKPKPDPPVVPPSSPLSVTLTEVPFVCDGTSHTLGTLTGAAPGERVNFSSPQEQGLLPATANASGALALRWQCGAADGGRTWSVTARGSSGGSVTFTIAGKTPAAPQPPATYAETVGGNSHSWTNYTNAGGAEGPVIPRGATVQVSCAIEGFRVPDGNVWWYRIASSPWNNSYYVSADAFYNNGSTSGSLSGTPFVDPKVPHC